MFIKTKYRPYRRIIPILLVSSFVVFFLIPHFLKKYHYLDANITPLEFYRGPLAPKEVLAVKPEDVRSVVSFSTFAGRAEKAGPTLESLLKQEQKPDQIYVFMPRKVERLNIESKEFPKELTDLAAQSNGLVKLVLMDEDYGPATKLLGALKLEQDPSTILITVDDDTYYDPKTVKTLIEVSKEHPEVPIAFHCETWNTWYFPQHSRPAGTEGICNGWQAAFKGTAYRRWMFDDRVFTVGQGPGEEKGCRLHDDVWLSGHLYRKGIRPYVIFRGFHSDNWHRPYDGLAIHVVKNGESHYRDPCARYFNYFQ